MAKADIKPGIYRHYKGNEYQVYDVATHSETEEKLVVYRPLYGKQDLWVRPYDMFIETVDTEGTTKPRFEWVREAHQQEIG